MHNTVMITWPDVRWYDIRFSSSQGAVESLRVWIPGAIPCTVSYHYHTWFNQRLAVVYDLGIITGSPFYMHMSAISIHHTIIFLLYRNCCNCHCFHCSFCYCISRHNYCGDNKRYGFLLMLCGFNIHCQSVLLVAIDRCQKHSYDVNTTQNVPMCDGKLLETNHNDQVPTTQKIWLYML